jgi:alpha-L-fucosidase 2
MPPGKGPFPAVILVHGGGWTTGSKTANFVLPLFEPLTQTGFTWFLPAAQDHTRINRLFR